MESGDLVPGQNASDGGARDSRWVLSAWAFINPIEAFRIGVIAGLDPDLSLLGPVGATWARTLGVAGVIVVCVLCLLLWTVVPTALGWWWFRRSRAWSAL